MLAGLVALCFSACNSSDIRESTDELEMSSEQTTDIEKDTSATESKIEMESYAINPTGSIDASGHWFRYNGRLYQASSNSELSWVKEKPDMDNVVEIGEVKTVKGIPQNDMEGSKFDRGDIAYYDAERDVVIVHRVWITDFSWMILNRTGK